MKISLLADCPAATPQLAQWYFDEWAHKDPETTLASVTEKVALGALNRDQLPVAFVVQLENQPVGAGELKYRELAEYPGMHDWLDGIYVPAAHRGKGISTLLIEFAKQKATELALPALYLRCEAHNVKLYEKHGFHIICARQHKLIMGCELADQY